MMIEMEGPRQQLGVQFHLVGQAVDGLRKTGPLRGVFAPPGIRDGDLEELSETVGKMVETPQWQDTLKTRGWLNMYQPHDEFAAFLEENTAQVTDTLKSVGLVN